MTNKDWQERLTNAGPAKLLGAAVVRQACAPRFGGELPAPEVTTHLFKREDYASPHLMRTAALDRAGRLQRFTDTSTYYVVENDGNGITVWTTTSDVLIRRRLDGCETW